MIKPLLKRVWQFPKKFNIDLPHHTDISILGIHRKEVNKSICSHKDLYTNSHSSFICNTQNLEQPKCAPTGGWIDRLQ